MTTLNIRKLSDSTPIVCPRGCSSRELCKLDGEGGGYIIPENSSAGREAQICPENYLCSQCGLVFSQLDSDEIKKVMG